MQSVRRRNYQEATSKEYPSLDASLPGTRVTARQMGGERVTILTFADRSKHITVTAGQKPEQERCSWDVDASGSYVFGSAHFSDSSSKRLRGKYADQERWFDG